MSFSVPSLSEMRALARDSIASKFKLGALLPNSRARFLADANAALAHLCLKYITWLSEQIFPDKAGEEWLRGRHAKIWLGSAKSATYAQGSVLFSGVAGTIIPERTRFASSVSGDLRTYETTEAIVLSADPTPARSIALTAGRSSNVDPGTVLSLTSAVEGAESSVTVVTLDGGIDAEDKEDLRTRILQRIRNPPMGGDAEDYVAWALAIPGVTRAWCAPLEMGIGTVSIRVMMDVLRANINGFPTSFDLEAIAEEIDKARPVAVKDRFILAPIPEPISFTIRQLVPDNLAVKATIEKNVATMLNEKAAPARAKNGVMLPAQDIFKVWISNAIMETDGVESFKLECEDFVMPSNGSLAVLGTISYSV